MMHLSDIRAWLWLWSGASVRLVLLCRWLNLTQRTWKASNKVTAPTHTIRIHFSLSQSNKLPFIHSHWHIHSAFTITIAQPWEKLTPILPPLSWSSGTRLATKATTFTQTLAKSLWIGEFVFSQWEGAIHSCKNSHQWPFHLFFYHRLFEIYPATQTVFGIQEGDEVFERKRAIHVKALVIIFDSFFQSTKYQTFIFSTWKSHRIYSFIHSWFLFFICISFIFSARTTTRRHGRSPLTGWPQARANWRRPRLFSLHGTRSAVFSRALSQ